jgi:hypothetical protein
MAQKHHSKKILTETAVELQERRSLARQLGVCRLRNHYMKGRAGAHADLMGGIPWLNIQEFRASKAPKPCKEHA